MDFTVVLPLSSHDSQAEVEKKTAMLMEVKKHLREAAERERAFKTATGDSQVKCED